MPDSSSSSISPPSASSPPLPFPLFGGREWRLAHAYRQQRLQRRHTVYQTGNAMPRLQCRLPVFRLPDGLIFCAVSLLIKAALTCSQTSTVIPPVIVNGPPPHYIYNPSDTTTLLCVASGTLPLTYNWFQDGEKLEPNSNTVIQRDGSLTLNSQNIPIEGYFQCRVQNAAGVAISNVTHLQPAVMVDVKTGRYGVQRLNLQVCESLVLNCTHVVRSIPQATMSWYFDGDKPVPLNDRVTVAENGSLVFAYLRESDSNHNSSTIYRCLAYNPIAKREFGGSYYHLTVSGMKDRSDEPELLYSSPAFVSAVEGQQLKLSCLFGGVPTPLVEWLLPNGTVVTNIPQLVIESARSSDQGNYTCRGKSVRRTTEEHFQVIIDALPRIETELKEQVARRGSTVRFQCPTVGRPKPAVSWFINGAPFNASFDDDSLILFDVQNSSSISCNVSNVHGYNLSSTYLLVVEHDVIMTTSSQGRMDDDTSAPSSVKATPTTKTTYAEGSERHWSGRGDGFSRSSSTPSNNSETGKHTVSDDTIRRGSLWFLIVLPMAGCLVAAVIVFLYCRHKRKRSYSLNDHESQLGLQARNRDLETNGDSDDSGYDDVSRKPKQPKAVKRLSDTPEVEESYL